MQHTFKPVTSEIETTGYSAPVTTSYNHVITFDDLYSPRLIVWINQIIVLKERFETKKVIKVNISNSSRIVSSYLITGFGYTELWNHRITRIPKYSWNCNRHEENDRYHDDGSTQYVTVVPIIPTALSGRVHVLLLGFVWRFAWMH